MYSMPLEPSKISPRSGENRPGHAVRIVSADGKTVGHPIKDLSVPDGVAHPWVHSSSIFLTHHLCPSSLKQSGTPSCATSAIIFFSGNIRFQNKGCKTYSFAVTRRTTLNQQLHVCKKLNGNQALSTHLHAFCSPAFVLIQTVS